MKKSHRAHLLWAVLALVTGTALSQDPLEKIAAKPTHAAVEGGVPVQVVDEAGEPLAGVAVVLITQKDMESPEVVAWLVDPTRARATDPVVLMTEMAGLLGSKFVTDEGGRTAVPRAERAFLIAFREGEVTYRELGSPPPAEGIHLAFVPPLRIDIEVADSRGRPAGDVPIGIGTRMEPMPLFRPIAQTRTDGDGHARIRIERERFRGYTKLFVEALVPLKEPLSQELDVADRQPDAVRLQLPPTGQLRVIVYDEQERPRPGVTDISLHSATDQNPRRLSLLPPPYEPSVLEEDNAIFAHVGLGMEFEAVVTLDGIQGSLRGSAAGPTRPGEMTILTVRAVEGPPILPLRILDADGQPIAKETVGVAMKGNEHFVGRTQETDAEGVLRVALEQNFMGGDGTLTVLRREVGQWTQYRGAARLNLRGDYEPGENPVTELVIEEEPVLVSGRVLDQDGKPLSGATVRTDLAMESGANGTSRRGLPGYLEHSVGTDEEGRFTLRELAAGTATVSLQVRLDGYTLVGATEFPAGTSDAEVVLARGGRVVGSFRELPQGQLYGLGLRLVPTEGPRPESGHGVGRDGSFTFDPVLAGTYSLEVQLRTSEEPALTIPDLTVEAGQSLRDPRLQDMQWREFSRAITFTVLDENRRPRPRISTMYYRRNNGNGWRGSGTATDNEGRATFLVEKGSPTRFAIESQEHLMVRLENVTESQEVILRPRPLLEVSLKGDLKLPEGMHLIGELSFEGPPGGEDSWGRSESQAPFDAEGVARIPVPSLEALQLTVTCMESVDLPSVFRRSPPAFEQEVEIDPDVASPRIEIEITDEHRRQIQQAISRIRR